MLGHALCNALSFHSQTITHSITNNLPQSKQLLRSLNNGCELLPIVKRPDLVPLHYLCGWGRKLQFWMIRGRTKVNPLGTKWGGGVENDPHQVFPSVVFARE